MMIQESIYIMFLCVGSVYSKTSNIPTRKVYLVFKINVHSLYFKILLIFFSNNYLSITNEDIKGVRYLTTYITIKVMAKLEW